MTQFPIRVSFYVGLCAQATFAAALTSQCGVDAATASNHFDAFCAFKDSPEVKYQEYCQACLAVLPGDRAAKIDSKHTPYCVPRLSAHRAVSPGRYSGIQPLRRGQLGDDRQNRVRGPGQKHAHGTGEYCTRLPQALVSRKARPHGHDGVGAPGGILDGCHHR